LYRGLGGFLLETHSSRRRDMKTMLIGVDHGPQESIAGFEGIKKFIGGYVEVVYLPSGRILCVDEDGLAKGLPLNLNATNLAGRCIVGRAVLADRSVLREGECND
jgi:hypothetical protein